MNKKNIWKSLILLVVIFLGGFVDVTKTSECAKSVTLYANFTKQSLTSPNFPAHYPRPSSCGWLIQATEGNIIVLRYWTFDLMSSIFCHRDLFTVIDGNTGWHPELMSMCGSFSKTGFYRTTEPAAIVKFRAITEGGNNQGFNISYWTETMVLPPYRSADYNIANYLLMGASGGAFILFLIGVAWLLRSHYQKKKAKLEDDDDYDNVESVE